MKRRIAAQHVSSKNDFSFTVLPYSPLNKNKTSPNIISEISPFDNEVRPGYLQDFSGQNQLVENLQIFIKAAKERGEALDHTLFHGPPGLGKTTLSKIIANEMNTTLKETSGPIIEKPSDLAGVLINLKKNDILFIDEIHRLHTTIEEYLYSAMEDFRIDILIDSGPNAKTVQLVLEPFTLVGATTRTGLLSSPLLSRFSIKFRLEYYTIEILEKIIHRSSRILDIDITQDAASEIARRSRGTPRIANALLRRVRDFAQVKNNNKVNLDIAQYALNAMHVDEFGLDEMDNHILNAIIVKFKGGPVGISTISTAIGEEAGTIEEVYEPFLIQEGFLTRTPRGRVATRKAYHHLKIKQDDSKSLFH